MGNQPLQPLNRKPKTKFPESASALIHNQKQNSRSLFPRWYGSRRSGNYYFDFCFSGKSETAVPVSFPGRCRICFLPQSFFTGCTSNIRLQGSLKSYSFATDPITGSATLVMLSLIAASAMRFCSGVKPEFGICFGQITC